MNEALNGELDIFNLNIDDLETKVKFGQKQLENLFSLDAAPPGFSGLDIPRPSDIEDEIAIADEGVDFNYDDTTDLATNVNPITMQLYDGSLQGKLAFEMQNAVDMLRSNTARTLDQIMIQNVSEYSDNLGPCTSVECLLSAAVESARVFILEK